MDLEKRIELICRPPTEEVLTPDDLRQLLETEQHPVAYNGWEPSGLVHLGTGVICAYKMKDFADAGLRFKAFLATWHGWLNNKLGGDLALYFFVTPDVNIPAEQQVSDGLTDIYVSKKQNDERSLAWRVVLRNTRKLALDGAEIAQGDTVCSCLLAKVTPESTTLSPSSRMENGPIGGTSATS